MEPNFRKLRAVSIVFSNRFLKSRLAALCFQKCGLLPIAVLAVATLTLCQRSATVVTSVAYFPSNSTWNTAVFRVVVQARGELDAEYTHVGEKQVTITVSDQKMERAKTQHLMNAGDLVWTVAWTDIQELEITFSEKIRQEHRQLRAIRFALDTRSHIVTEVKTNTPPVPKP